MPIALRPDSPKRHVNLTLREDLYGIAQDSAREAGVSVSALFERWLLALSKRESQALPRPRPTQEIADLRGILTGPLAGLTKAEARALRHETRLERGGL